MSSKYGNYVKEANPELLNCPELSKLETGNAIITSVLLVIMRLKTFLNAKNLRWYMIKLSLKSLESRISLLCSFICSVDNSMDYNLATS